MHAVRLLLNVHHLVRTESGHLYMWGRNSLVIDSAAESERVYAVPIQLFGGTGRQPAVRAVACGAWHALAVSADGSTILETTVPRSFFTYIDSPFIPYGY